MKLRAFSRSSRRITVALCAAGLLGGVVAAPAAVAAEREPTKDQDLITEFLEQAIGGTLWLSPDGRKSKLIGLNTVTRLVDEVGQVLSPQRTQKFVATGGGSPLSEYSCVYQGRKVKRLSVYPVKDIFQANERGNLQFMFHAYRLDRARRVVTVAGHKSSQYEVCANGGADLKDGFRIKQVGAGLAYPSTTRTVKIGEKWRTGETPENYTLGLGFQVQAGKAPITISGSISQTPTDKLMGSINAPFPSWMDAFARNGSNAWWQDNCTRDRCAPWNGSPNFQGTVVQGLYEVSPREVATFPGIKLNTYLKSACQNPFTGCG